MIPLLISGVGRIDVDIENCTLTPSGPMAAFRLWWMIQKHPRKAAQRMDLCEQLANEYVEDDLGWLWDLPVPPNYRPCPCCVC